MNQSMFKFVLASVQSLKDRTNLTAFYGGCRVELTRRNSPYVSHQGVEFSLGNDEAPNSLVMWINEYEGIAIHDRQLSPDERESWANEDGTSAKWRETSTVTVPFVLLEDLVAEICRETGGFVPMMDNASTVVDVVVWRRRVESWDDDGRPVFVTPG